VSLGDFPVLEPTKVNLMDVAPNQIASIASIFNSISSSTTMQTVHSWDRTCSARLFRLLRPRRPIVGTGLEGLVARDSRVLIIAEGGWNR
jgi:DNA-directed RNA polymerase subunit beta